MSDFGRWLTNLAHACGLPTGVMATLAMLFGALTVGTAIRLSWAWRAPIGQRAERLGSLLVWWILAVVVTVSVCLGKWAVALAMAISGILALRELLALTWEGRHNRAADPLAYPAVALQFFLAAYDRSTMWLTFLPTAMLLLLAIRLVLTGTTVGYVHDVSATFWAVMTAGYLLSHAVAVTHIPDSEGQWAALWIYLLVLTEGNDIAQALWGRKFGRHRVTPTISPNKTWEGLLFGMATTVVAAVALSPLLLDWFWWQAALAGLVIAVSGFFGDINMSALKRDVGVKDSSRLLPGQGGMLDRVDSLSFSAPVFYYFSKWVMSGGGGAA